MKDRERGRQRHRQREKQASCREPDMGLDLGSPGSRLGPKAGAKPLSHPGITWVCFLFVVYILGEFYTYMDTNLKKVCFEREKKAYFSY